MYVKEDPTMHYLGIPRIAWAIVPCTCKIFGNTSPQLCCGNVVNIYYYRGQGQGRTGPRSLTFHSHSIVFPHFIIVHFTSNYGGLSLRKS